MYPSVKFINGFSNISSGMPLRRVVKQAIMTIAMYACMDSVIVAPCNQEMLPTWFATKAILGRTAIAGTNNTYRQKHGWAGKRGEIKL
jgi:5-methyltetrahydrofolate--homocysteine methyltransferase